MRFAFKTSPQNTTWADMLAVWRAADDIERVRVRLDLRPLLPDLLRPDRALPRGWVDAHRAGPGHHAGSGSACW